MSRHRYPRGVDKLMNLKTDYLRNLEKKRHDKDTQVKQMKMNELFEEIMDTKNGFRRDYSCFVQKLPHEENLNNKQALPKILKPGIKLKILSESEVDGRQTFDEFREDFNLIDHIKINDKINQIKGLRGKNAVLIKIKKQMEIRKNFMEIYKQVEKKTLELEKKIFENKNFNISNSDHVFINKEFGKGITPNNKLAKSIDIDMGSIKDSFKLTLPKIIKK